MAPRKPATASPILTRLRAYRLREAQHRIVLDSQVVEQFRETFAAERNATVALELLKARADAGQGADPGALDAAQGELDRHRAATAAAQALLDEQIVELRLRALPAAPWRELMSAHQPTKDQAGHLFNFETLPAALISASVVDAPDLTPEAVQELQQLLSQADYEALFTAAWDLSTNRVAASA